MQISKDNGYVNEIISEASNIAIMCGNGGTDSVAAGIALKLYIEEHWDKMPIVIFNGDFADVNPQLLEICDVATNFEPKTLRITLDYADTNIKTVDYYKHGDSELILEIKPVDSNFDVNRIKYDIDGVHYDLIITLGVPKLSKLGSLYNNAKDDFEKAVIVNIDNSKENRNYGKINIVNPDAVSLSSLVLSKFAEWNYIPSNQAGKSLLLGFEMAR